MPATKKIWAPSKDSVTLAGQRVLLVQASAPPNRDVLVEMMRDKLVRLLEAATEQDLQDLEEVVDLAQAYQLANANPRAQAAAMLEADSLAYLISRGAGTQARLLPESLKAHLEEQTLGSLALDLAQVVHETA